MRDRGLTIRSLALTGVTGVVLAHALDYVAVFPHGHERSEVLAAAGHGYWPLAVTAAVGAGVALLVGAARSGWRDGRAVGGASGSHRGSWPPVAALAASQLVLFTGIEIVERTTVGVDPLVLGRSPEFWVGLVLQVAVAIGAVVLLRTVHRAARRLAATRARRWRSRVRAPWELARLAVLRSVTGRSWRSRAPPAIVG